MLKNLRINKYRGLSGIELNNLQKVNILVGENNAGKTSVLEAIQILENSDSPFGIISVARKREIPIPVGLPTSRLIPYDLLMYSFNMKDEQKEIYIEGNYINYSDTYIKIKGMERKEYFIPEEYSKEELRMMYPLQEDDTIRCFEGEFESCFHNSVNQEKIYWRETDRIPVNRVRTRAGVVYISPLDVYLNRSITGSLYKGMRVEDKQKLISLLRIFDERIVSIETVTRAHRPYTYIELEDCGLAPISIFGDGFKKVLAIANAMIRNEDGIVLIDEFETGIHKRALTQVAEWLIQAANRFNVQVFLTTHSSEAIDALTNIHGTLEDINAYRLEHYRDSIYVDMFSGNRIYDIRRSQGSDIL